MALTNVLLRQTSGQMGQGNPNVLCSPHIILRRQETSESYFDSSDSDSEIDLLDMNNSL